MTLSTELQPTYRVSVNCTVVGKTDADKLSQSASWQPSQMTLGELAVHIGKGHPWMPAILNDGARRRQHEANYAEVLAADIDGVISIEQAMELPIVRHCGLIIESSSSTPDQNKYRLVFPLEAPLTNWTDIRLATVHLIAVLRQESGVEAKTAVDGACKDASRFFFGGLGRTPRLLNPSAKLPADFFAQAQAREEADRARFQAESDRRKADFAKTDKTKLLDLAVSALDYIPAYEPGNNTYDDLLTMCAGVLNDFGSTGLAALEAWGGFGHGTTKKLQGLERTQAARSAGIGSLFWLARQYGWNFPEPTTEEKRAYAEMKRSERVSTPPKITKSPIMLANHICVFSGCDRQGEAIARQHQMSAIAVQKIDDIYAIPAQLEQLGYPKNILLIPAPGDISNPKILKAWNFIARTIAKENESHEDDKTYKSIELSVFWEGQWDDKSIKVVGQKLTWKQWFSASVGTDAAAYEEWVASRAFSPDHTIDSKYFTFRNPEEGEILLIRSGLGSGKTHWVIDMLKQMGKRSIVFVPTNNLGRSFKERSGGLMMSDLATGNAAIDDAYKADVEQAILCLDSVLLISLEQAKGAIVVIDELELVLRVLVHGSTHIKKIRAEATEHFQAILALAHSVVGLDGGLTDWCSDLIYRLCPSKKLTKISNSHKNVITFNFDLGTENQFKGRLAKMLISANAGRSKPVFLATDSRADGQENVQYPLNSITSKQGLLQADGSLLEDWGGEMAKKTTAFLRENNARTASITMAGGAGISIELEDYFGALPVLALGVVGPSNILQLSARPRDLKILRDIWVAERGLKEKWILEMDAITEMASAEALFRFLQDGLGSLSLDEIDRESKRLKALHRAIAVCPLAQFLIKEQAIRAAECKNLRGWTIAAARMNGHIVNLVTIQESEIENEETKQLAKEHRENKRRTKLDFIGAFKFAVELTAEEEQKANNADRLAPGMHERLALTAITRSYPGIRETASWMDESMNEKGESNSAIFINRIPKLGKKATAFFFLTNQHIGDNKAKIKWNKWLNTLSIDLTQLGGNHTMTKKMHRILMEETVNFVGLNYSQPKAESLTPYGIEEPRNLIGSSINKDQIKAITDRMTMGTKKTRQTLNGKTQQSFLKSELENFGYDVRTDGNGLYVSAPCLDPSTELGAIYGTIVARYTPKTEQDVIPHKWELSSLPCDDDAVDGLEQEFTSILRSSIVDGCDFEVEVKYEYVFEFEDDRVLESCPPG